MFFQLDLRLGLRFPTTSTIGQPRIGHHTKCRTYFYIYIFISSMVPYLGSSKIFARCGTTLLIFCNEYLKFIQPINTREFRTGRGVRNGNASAVALLMLRVVEVSDVCMVPVLCSGLAEEHRVRIVAAQFIQPVY